MDAGRATVCFVTQELPQFLKNGGAGTATLGFAETLAASQFDVSILYITDVAADDPRLAATTQELKDKGISLVFLRDVTTYSMVHVNLLYRSYAIYLWLSDRHFDFIHFADFDGPAFYTMLAKNSGLHFENSQIIIFAHGPHRWACDITEEFYDQNRLMVDYMERRSIELADCLMHPSDYIRNYLTSTGLRLPKKVVRQRGILPALSIAEADGADPVACSGPVRITELVYFGRHEVRKGILLFIAAAAKILASDTEMKVTFLGRAGSIYGVDSRQYIKAKLADYADRIGFFSPEDRRDLLPPLQRRSALVVIPSIDENLPNTVFELIQWGVNFIASGVGGIPELLAGGADDPRLFHPTVEDLVAKIRQCMEQPPPPVALAFDPDQERRGFADWHKLPNVSQPDVGVVAGPKPVVSVCVVHYDRPAYLRQAIASLQAQTYPAIEVILVDDGSPSEAAKAEVARLRDTSSRVPILVVHTPDIGLGAARNAGAARASGQFILFMDDDNVACDNMVETLVHAATASKADVLTCLSIEFSSREEPDESMRTEAHHLPLGGAVALGMFTNCFGDAHTFWNASAFRKLGGFSESRAPSEDWELLARTCLRGYRLDVVPAQLYWRRVHSNSLSAKPYSKWQTFTQIADLYAVFRPTELQLILRAGQRYTAFSAGLKDPYTARTASGDASGDGPLERLTDAEQSVIANSSGAATLQFQERIWRDQRVDFETPRNFAGAAFRAYVIVESDRPAALRFCFITPDWAQSASRWESGEPAHVADTWQTFEPGTTCFHFLPEDCAPLRGEPDFNCVTSLLFGGAPGAAAVRACLTMIKDGVAHTILETQNAHPSRSGLIGRALGLGLRSHKRF